MISDIDLLIFVAEGQRDEGRAVGRVMQPYL